MSETLLHDHGNNNLNNPAIKCLPEIEEISYVSDAMKQLGDPSRARIFWLLCHTEECVINIAEIVGMSSPAVAHHLKLLKNAGLILSRRSGKEMYYKAADTEIVDALHHSLEKILKISCPEYTII